MEHDGCKGCAYENEGVTGKHCVYCERTKQGDMYKRATNADRIRSMSDEEMAIFLKDVKNDYQWMNPDYPSEDDFDDWLEWLKT